MRVFDCFTFFNEIDLLRLRLTELYNIVDRFVIVEADRTFTNRPKPLYFHDTRETFAPFIDKIIHVVVRDMPDGDNPWVREQFQRDAIIRGLPALDPMDVVIISDVDEIPRPESIATMRMTRYRYYGLRMPEFYFKLNFVNLLYHGVQSVAVRPPIEHSAEHIRRLRVALSHPEVLAQNAGLATLLHHAGWHFSYLGDNEFVRLKIQAFAHQEYNRPTLLASIDVDKLICGRKDLFDRNSSQWDIVRFDDYFPRSVHLMPEFKRWIASDDRARSLSRDPEESLKLLP